MDTFEFNYKTTLPKIGNAPCVKIKGDGDNEYDVLFYVNTPNENKLLKITKCRTNQTIYAELAQWFVNWYIEIRLNGKLITSDKFDPKNKVVFIKIDGHALGDNISWIPYVEEFRKFYNCKVICSTFFNDLFKDVYKEILFVKPNTNIENVYSQYYIGAGYDGNIIYSPIMVNKSSLQYVAISILNLPPIEIRPPLEKLLVKRNNHKKYVCISEYASDPKKMWKYDNGWQVVVDFLNSIGYQVVVISKEETNLQNVIDLTGDQSLFDRAQTLYNAEFFIGTSSGLSWLAWAVNTHVFMISDVTHKEHEFRTNITRITANPDLREINYEVENITKPEIVIENIKQFLNIVPE